MKELWKRIVFCFWYLILPRHPDLTRTTRIRRYPLGTRYKAPDGRVYRYVRKINSAKKTQI